MPDTPSKPRYRLRYGSSPIRMVTPVVAYPSVERHRLRTGKKPAERALADQLLTARALELMRAECRAAMREHALARALVGRLEDFVVGDGFIVTPNSPDPKWNKAASVLWERWSRSCTVRGAGRNYTQVLRGIVHSWMTAGDELIVQTLSDIGNGPEGLIQEIEGDRVCNPGGTLTHDDPGCIAGVEMDQAGCPWYYHVVDRAEALADNYAYGSTTPVPAEFCALMVNPLSEMLNQTRGEPGLHTSVQWLEMLSKYCGNQITVSNIATMFGLVFKTEAPGQTLSQLQENIESGQSTFDDGDEKKLELGPGFTLALKPGESIEQVKPEWPQQSTREFVNLIAQVCAADVGLPVFAVLLDPSDVNFHSFKSAISMTWPRIAFAQDVLFDLTRRLFAWKVTEWMNAGKLGIPSGVENDVALACECSISGPNVPSPDLGKDIDAYGRAVEKNMITLAEVTNRLGFGNAERIREQRQVERADEIARGIVPPTMPGAMPGNMPGNVPGNVAGDGAGDGAGAASEPVPKADGDGEEQEK